jgi:glycosyltransferase involved in cell wall biosynthesis
MTEVEPAVVHDFLVSKGGAERVVLSIMRAFPKAPLYTLLYDNASTFPEFRNYDVRPSPLNRVAWLRAHHRASLPLAPAVFARMRVDSAVVICSSSGWAHGVSTSGKKLVLCYNPARWLYQPDQYFGAHSFLKKASIPARSMLRRWDRNAARTAAIYMTISSVVRDRIQRQYGLNAEVVHPPPTLDPQGTQTAMQGIKPGYFLCVSRLLPYKNVDKIIGAFRLLGGEELVVVGEGPETGRLHLDLPANVRLVGAVSDSELIWLYSRASAVVAASHEDYGLTPLEGYLFGKPSVTLEWGGFLDTVDADRTGVMFDRPDPQTIAEAINRLKSRQWDPGRIRQHVSKFSEDRFIARIREVTADLARPRGIGRAPTAASGAFS